MRCMKINGSFLFTVNVFFYEDEDEEHYEQGRQGKAASIRSHQATQGIRVWN